ncbi:MAG: L,D-transpeptidase family protein [bacterium]
MRCPYRALMVLSGWAVVAMAAPVPVPIKVSTTMVTRVNGTDPLARPARPLALQNPDGGPPASAANLLQLATLQTALDRNGFGVGLIDGREGAKTVQALKDYAQSRGVSVSQARKDLLAEAEPATLTHTLTAEELAEVGSAPADYLEAAALPAMACENLEEVLAEQFHVSPTFLKRLNPAITNWETVAAGSLLVMPNTRAEDWTLPAARLEVDCNQYRVRAFNTNDTIIASFPCSIAKNLHKVPVGDLTIVSFAPNPNYTFDPANFPESPRAQEIGKKLIIPPGPNNPVGVYWLTLSAAGFGMHGTPHPETIGRRESHGCFRLTNWDITTLASMVEEGTPVTVKLEAE